MGLKKKNYFFLFFLIYCGFSLSAQEKDHEVKEFDEMSPQTESKPSTHENMEPQLLSPPEEEGKNDFSDYLLTEVKEYGLMAPAEDEVIEKYLEPQEPVSPRKKKAGKKETYGLKNRSFEIGSNANVNVANNFIAALDIFKRPFNILMNLKDIINKDFGLIYRDKIVINIDEFFNGFKFDFNASIKPLFIKINSKDKWGWGLDIGHTDIIGNVTLPGEMLKLEEAKDVKAGFGGAAFTDIGIPVFFHIKNLKIKLRPAVYVPLFYVEPGITYNFGRSFHNGNEGMRIEAIYKIDVYSPAKIENSDFSKVPDYLSTNYWQILRENLGYDLGLGLEYSLNSRLSMGADFFNIPFYTAKLYDYLKFHGEAFVDSSFININDVLDQLGDYEVPEDAYGYPEEYFEKDYKISSLGNKDGKKIFRPFKMIFHGYLQPFKKPILVFVPSLGFSVSRIFVKKAAMEGGITGILNLRNIFIIKGGINYNDRLWINSIDFILNIRALELNFGISSQSQQFKKSFNYSGLGVNVGVKLGF